MYFDMHFKYIFIFVYLYVYIYYKNHGGLELSNVILLRKFIFTL